MANFSSWKWEAEDDIPLVQLVQKPKTLDTFPNAKLITDPCIERVKGMRLVWIRDQDGKQELCFGITWKFHREHVTVAKIKDAKSIPDTITDQDLVHLDFAAW